jgi:hypothetical protein
MRRGAMKSFASVMAVLALAMLPARLSATWSILVFDPATGRVIIASATCAASGPDNLKLVQAVVVPGVGVGANQSSVDGTQRNHKLMYEELLKGTDPDSIIRLMEKADSARIESRQIGIVDVKGRAAGRSGSGNSSVAMDIQGTGQNGIVFSVQGNIIASEAALTEAARVLRETGGDVIDRVMRAMETASDLGGDRRCTCETGSGGPLPGMPCTKRASSTAYILVADPTDARGRYAEFHPQVPNRVQGDPSNTRSPWNDGDYYLYLAAYPSNTKPTEDSNPVRTLRMRYDAWKAQGRPRMNMAVPSPPPNPVPNP